MAARPTWRSTPSNLAWPSCSRKRALFDAIGADLERVVDAAGDTLRQAGLGPDAVDALYLTGGSTGLTPLAQRLAAVCPAAPLVRGDRFASVAQGLGLHAQRLLAPTQRT